MLAASLARRQWPSASDPAILDQVGRARAAAAAKVAAASEDSLDALPTPPLTPQAWCRRVLTSLNQRQVTGREAGNLEMLLTYFIERDPTHENFNTLLAQFVADPRTGIAEAAGLLQQSWLRGRTGSAAPPFPPLAEALRTVGGLLDDANVRYAHIAVTSQGIRLLTFGGGEPSQRTIDLAELQQEIAARTALRGQVPPTSTVRRELLLRTLGWVLEPEPAQDYDIIVTPRAVVVDGAEQYYRLFSAEELVELAVEGIERRSDEDDVAEEPPRGHAPQSGSAD
jgi:hypothetical protein